MGKITYVLDLAHRYMVSLILGATPQQLPDKMRLAIAVLEAIGFDNDKRKEYGEIPIWDLMSKEPKNIDLTPAQAKFIPEITVPNANWNGDFLRMWVPLWDRLYPQWEEFVPEPEEEKPISEDQGEE